MQLIDAQIHAVLPVAELDAGLSHDQGLAVSAELAVASMDAVGVTAAVVSDHLATVRGYLAAHPNRFAGVPYIAWPELESDFPVTECLAELGATPGMVGIRLIIATEARAEILRTGVYESYLIAAERNGLAVFVTLPGQVSALHDSIRRHPDLTFVIDHLGLYTPTSLPQGVDPLVGLPEVLALARYPNVTVKCTGVPSLSSQPYPFTDVWPTMHRFLDAFGVERLFWGSDFTRCKPLHTYREAVDFLLSTEEVTAAEKEALFSGSITRWLRWSPSGSVRV